MAFEVKYLIAYILGDETRPVLGYPGLPAGVLPAQDGSYADEEGRRPDDDNHQGDSRFGTLMNVVDVGNGPIPETIQLSFI